MICRTRRRTWPNLQAMLGAVLQDEADHLALWDIAAHSGSIGAAAVVYLVSCDAIFDAMAIMMGRMAPGCNVVRVRRAADVVAPAV